MMRSNRLGLSEYTTQRLAELQAIRLANEANDSSYDRKSHYTQSSRYHGDECLRTSQCESNGSDRVASPKSDDIQSTATKVTLPSALLENKKSATSSRVGYTSLALPPADAYRPLKSNIYDGDTYEKYSRYSEINNSNGRSTPTDSRMELDSSLPVIGLHFEMTRERNDEIRKKSVTLDSAERKSSLAITPDVGCIGFAKLPDQVHRKAIKRGFDFTLMVVGESGLGKSTLVTSMFFQNDLYKDRTIPGVEEKVKTTVQIQKRQVEIEELGVRLRLTIIDTPGFNDGLNSAECWKTIDNYIQDQFEQYLHDESGINRQTIQDNRVHCCLYFISPYGRGLRPIDVDFMKKLQNRVNIVPIIAKADVLTPKELMQFKSKVMEEICAQKIQIYEMPPTDNDEDEDFKRKDKQIKRVYPFAVIGGNALIEVDGKRVQGRVYPWGIVEAENPEYSDVALLRQFLVSTHLHDLKEVTKDVHYENFRSAVFDQKTKSLPVVSKPQTDANKLLKEKEEEIRRMHMVLQKMQAQLHGGYAR